MLRSIAITAFVGLTIFAVAACDSGWAQRSASGDSDDEPVAGSESRSASVDIGKPLYAPKEIAAPRIDPANPQGVAVDPVVVPCHLTVVNKEDVPSLRDGSLNFIGTELKPGELETLPKDLVIEVPIAREMKKFRRLREGDYVEKDQLMAMLDDRLARADKASKDAKVAVAEAELIAARKTTEEARARYDTQVRLAHTSVGKVTSEEELRGAKLLWEKSGYEAVGKQEAVKQAKLESESAQTVLELHEIRASMPGVILHIYKSPGEAVRSGDPVFSLRDLKRIRADGLLDRQQVPKLQNATRIVIEPSEPQNPQQTLIGHFQEITGVAVSNDPKNPVIVSSSDDGTVRVWDRTTHHERRILRPAGTTSNRDTGVRAVACTPPGARGNLCLSGSADGSARIWDLDGQNDQPLRELSEHHHGAITCVAFSPDGLTCVTAGDDHQIRLWDTETGKLRYRFPNGHRAAVTAVQFTPLAQLVSTGRDNTLRIWQLGENGAHLEATLDRRSGEVSQLGVSPDGRTALFDQGRSLRLLSLPGGTTEGVLFNPTPTANFSTFALFSPDARLIVTAGATEGRLQLWRSPTPATGGRGYEVRQLVFYQRSSVPTCACFSPDGSYLVTGTRDKQVQIWSVPSQSEIEQELKAELRLVEKVVESTAGQVRIWADLPNTGDRLYPGTTVNMTIYPKQ